MCAPNISTHYTQHTHTPRKHQSLPARSHALNVRAPCASGSSVRNGLVAASPLARPACRSGGGVGVRRNSIGPRRTSGGTSMKRDMNPSVRKRIMHQFLKIGIVSLPPAADTPAAHINSATQPKKLWKGPEENLWKAKREPAADMPPVTSTAHSTAQPARQPKTVRKEKAESVWSGSSAYLRSWRHQSFRSPLLPRMGLH